MEDRHGADKTATKRLVIEMLRHKLTEHIRHAMNTRPCTLSQCGSSVFGAASATELSACGEAYPNTHFVLGH
eukprot:6073121-Amphidinium_carterae.1